MPYSGQKINSSVCWSLPLNCSDSEVYFEVFCHISYRVKLFWLWDVAEASLTVQDSFYSSVEEDLRSSEMLCYVDWQVAAEI
jgi:hypothetical protein